MKKLILSGLFALSFMGLRAQNYQLHSVFMYSFARYIQWPEESSAGDFSILVYGESPILPELNTLAGKKKIGDRAIRVTQISSVAEIKKCNILFVPADKSAQLAEILSKLGDASTLVVTEQTGARGSSINFSQKEGKLVFEMNSSSLNKRKLKASSELTRLAILI
jgi:YfiR/HmsC-like